MKKTLALLLAIVCILSVAACAEGKIKATQKTLCLFPGEDNAYFFAKIENVGDQPMGVGTGSLVMFTADDEILAVKDYISALPSHVLLQPGEYVYVRDFLWESALADAEVGDYKFSLEDYSYPVEIQRIPCEATFEIKGADSFENYIYVSFTNNDAEEKYGAYISAALLDAEGNVVYAEASSLGTVAVHPGSTVTVKVNIDNDMVKYFNANGIEPVSVDAMVCYMVQ